MTDHDATHGGQAYPQAGPSHTETPQPYPQGTYPYSHPGYGYAYGPGGQPGHPGYGQGGYAPPGYPPPGYYHEGPGRPAGQAHKKILAVVAAAAFAVGAGGTALATGAIHNPVSSSGGALSTSAIVSKADPSVVDIVSRLGNQGAAAAGTGIVLSSDGTVVTNNHVIDGATAIQVTDIGNGQTYSATVKGYDASRDIAVLKLNNASGLATAHIADSSEVRLNDKVVAVGNAGGRGGLPSVATGKVTGLSASITAHDENGSSERLTNVLRTNANIQPGDSGGPLLNRNGEVIGINTAAGTSGPTTSAATTTEAFAVPINRAMDIVRQIQSGTGSATLHIGATAFLGVAVSSQQQPTGGSGAGIVGTVQGGAASQAGITEGDQITSIAGRPVASATDIRDSLITHHPGDKVKVTWSGATGQQHTVTVTLGSGPPA